MNLSLDGICVAGQHVPRLNTLITVEVDLPKIAGPEPDTGLDLKEKDVLSLYGEGRVLWIDKAQGVFGALMWFRHLDPARDND